MYEAPEVLAIGEAQNLILGVKPFRQDYIDTEGWIGFNEPVEDIDESDD